MKTSVIEPILKRRLQVYLRQIQSRQGIEIRIYKQLDDVHQEVYGVDAGDGPELGDAQTIQGIITGDEFVPTSGFSSGSFQEGWLYTTSDLPAPGDIAEISASDQKIRRFKVQVREAIGTTVDVFYRFRLSALGA